jgi:hypothetical protein
MHLCFPECHEIHWVCQSDLDLGMERELLQGPFHEYVLAYNEKSETLAAMYACPSVNLAFCLPYCAPVGPLKLMWKKSRYCDVRKSNIRPLY